VKGEEVLAALKKKMDEAGGNSVIVEGVPSGMTVDVPGELEDEGGGEEREDSTVVKPTPKRKTKAQRNKAARLLVEVRSISLFPIYQPLQTPPITRNGP
jgi:nucleolar protein 53